MERRTHVVTDASDLERQLTHPVGLGGAEDKELRIQEAGELYGNLAAAEEYGYVTRGYVLFGCRFLQVSSLPRMLTLWM